MADIPILIQWYLRDWTRQNTYRWFSIWSYVHDNQTSLCSFNGRSS